MAAIRKFFRVIIFCSSLILVLSCNLISALGMERSASATAQTGIVSQIESTATHLAGEIMTLQARQTEMAGQVPDVQATWSPPPTWTSEPPAQTIQPSPASSETGLPAPASLVLDIQTSVDTFYCYDSPYELTITVTVSDIERGMAVYYHIQDKKTGKTSEAQVIDLHRKTGSTRAGTIIGGGSTDQNLQFPPLMGESYFLYQVISDDGTYRSPVLSDVTFFPCAQ